MADRRPDRVVQQVELIERSVEIVEHRSPASWCPSCRRHVYAPLPPPVVRASLDGARDVGPAGPVRLRLPARRHLRLLPTTPRPFAHTYPGVNGYIERHKEAQGKAAERSRLERERNALMAKQQDKARLAEQLRTLMEGRARLLESLSELRDQRFTLRKAIVAQINAALSPAIRVSLVQYGNPRQYQRLLEDTLKGNRLQQRVVAGKIVNAFWPAELAEIVKHRDAQALVDKAELNPDQANKVISVLAGSRVLFDLETVELADQPKIELNDNGTFKETTELSTGQKCTTILPILLLDSENPLLIDQPEDNLDNRFVFESIVATIGAIKRRRQLIFVTHNPNIPVLGEADRVFVMDSDGTTARKLNAGSVDDCKDNIVTLLEGGADAFRRRGQRYAS